MKQSRQIAALQAQISSMRMARKPRGGRPKQPKRAGPVAGPAKVSKVDDPIIINAQAQLKPFDIPRGIASPLIDGRPSQKLTVRGQAVISIPASCTMVFLCAPNVASDASARSVMFAIQTAAATPMSGPFNNAVVGNNVVAGGTLTYINTQTPYAGIYLSTNNVEYALAGAGLRFTYDGPELYRGGTFRYYHDLDSDLTDNTQAWAADGPVELINKVDGSINSIRQSINNNNVVEINAYVSTNGGYTESGNVNNTSYSPSADTTTNLVGGTTANSYFGVNPMCYGYYTNTSSNAVTFYVESVEHWSLHGGPIQSLQSPSYANVTLSEHVGTFLSTARQAHATQPNVHHTDVMKSTLKAAKSPIGSELLGIALRGALA